MTTPVTCEVIQIWADLHTQSDGYFRAYHTENKDSTTGVTFFGYCDSRGSHRTIKAVIAEVRLYDKDTPIYRNGKLVGPPILCSSKREKR